MCLNTRLKDQRRTEFHVSSIAKWLVSTANQWAHSQRYLIAQMVEYRFGK